MIGSLFGLGIPMIVRSLNVGEVSWEKCHQYCDAIMSPPTCIGRIISTCGKWPRQVRKAEMLAVSLVFLPMLIQPYFSSLF